MLLFALTFPGCLVSRDLYERRLGELTDHDGDGWAQEDDCDDGDPSVGPDADEHCDEVDEDCDGQVDDDPVDPETWYRDTDGDGHGDPAVTAAACVAPTGFVASSDDCDDTTSDVRPGAPDEWYDGVDANCDGLDDYDADGDGDPSDDFGGGDCNDDDPAVSSLASEGWLDAGVDNNCDRSVEDQALVDLGDIGFRIDGDTAGGSFGTTILTLPAGWIAPETSLLVSAPHTTSGDVYGWRASDLADSPSIVTAPWHIAGDEDAEYVGYGMGWAGSESDPLVVVGWEGVDSGRGEAHVWHGGDWAGDPAVILAGTTVGTYFGSQMVSGYDHDGDGVDDLVVTAVLDSRHAANAGAAFVFLEPEAMSGTVSAADADVTFTTTYAGAVLSVTDVGDADQDGLEDLGFTQDIPYPTGPGGLLVTGARAPGEYDVTEASVAQILGGPFLFGKVWDPDNDGVLSLYGGTISRFDLPIEGAVTPWDDGAGDLLFATPTYATMLRTDCGDYAGHAAFLAVSHAFEGSSGLVSVQRPWWHDGQTVEEAPFMAVGDAAGDQAGYGLDLLDVDDDGVLDIAVGAPGADFAAVGAGAVYIVPGPR